MIHFFLFGKRMRMSEILFVAVGLLLASCEKEAIGQSSDSTYREQALLLKEVRLRNQVTAVSEAKNVLSVSFGDGEKVRLPEQVFPLIRAGEDARWTISGSRTEIAVRRSEAGDIFLPILSIGEDGYWCLDSLGTDFSAEAYLRFFAEEGNDTLNVTGVLLNADRFFIYLSDDSVRPYTITDDPFCLVPDYWMESLVEKETMAETAIREAEGDCNTFVFFTDTHWGKNVKKSPALIRHIYEFTPFTDVIFGGDVVTSHHTNLVVPMETGKEFQSAFSFLGTHFHCLYGNHDNNSDSQPGKTEYHLSEEQVFSFLQSQMTDVVYGGYYNFYYDNPATKTRIICLDTGRYYYAQFRDRLPETVSYAIGALSTVPEGWHVIMASHIWCTDKKQSDGTYTYYLESYIKPVLKVFDDYNARLSGTYAYKQQKVSYDFSQASGKIEFCIGGHIHNNFLTYSDSGIPVVSVISDYAVSPKRGTDKEQSVTLVVADYKNEKLNLFVVGRGSDRSIEL